MTFSQWVQWADQQMWGPGMLVLLMGTGIYLTVRTRFLPWRNLGYALRSALGREARVSSGGDGAVSPFSALMTALAATIGTGTLRAWPPLSPPAAPVPWCGWSSPPPSA